MGEGELRALLADYGEVRHLRMVNSKISGRCSKTWIQCMMWSPLEVDQAHRAELSLFSSVLHLHELGFV